MNDISDQRAGALLDRADYLRKTEKQGGFETGPIKAGVQFDWASAGLKIDKGAQQLNESLPNGQAERTAAAFRLLRQGVEELACFLRARGLDV